MKWVMVVVNIIMYALFYSATMAMLDNNTDMYTIVINGIISSVFFFNAMFILWSK